MKFDCLLLGEIIRERRNELGLSQNRLASLTGISGTEIRRIENGERKTPNIIILINICEILSIDFIKLLKITGFVDNKNLIMKGNYDMKDYKVTIRKSKEIDLGITTTDEERAVELANEFLEKNKDLFEENSSDSYRETTDIEVEEWTEDEEAFEEDDEDLDDDFDEEDDENPCEGCEYYCPNCGSCLL